MYLCSHMTTMRKLDSDELNRKSIEEFKESEKTPIALVLHNIRSMHNVGSMFRSSDAFLVAHMHLCGYTPRPPHRDIHKTALGATETVAWTYHASTEQCIASLKDHGWTILAVEQAVGSIPLHTYSLTFNQPLALVLGNELHGVDQEILDLCDACIEIPQWGMKHSLNVSVATGILLWELSRRFYLKGR